MRIIYVNQCLFTYFLIIFHAIHAATHWIVTEDGKIHTQDDSFFQIRRPYDLMSLLQQEKRADMFSQIKSQILLQKEEIESENFDNHEDVEQVIYQTNSDCIKATKPLFQFDLYDGTMVFSYPKTKNLKQYFSEDFPVNNLYNSYDELSSLSDSLNYFYPHMVTITSFNTSAEIRSKHAKSMESENVDTETINDKLKYAPNCSDYLSLDFSMTSFEHLASVRDRKSIQIDPEIHIHHQLGKWKTLQSFGKDISDGLKQNSTSWLLYTLASFYWRGVGEGEQAVECVRRALHYSPYEYRHIPLLSLGTILQRSHSLTQAAIVLHGSIDISPEVPHVHYMLGNIYAVLNDYKKSVICYDNVLQLFPHFNEARLRKHAVLCHSSIENALKAQHDTLQKTLDELKDYQRQQELWINYHKKLRAEQAPSNVLREQRLHYREFKARQMFDATMDSGMASNNGGTRNEAKVAANIRQLRDQKLNYISENNDENLQDIYFDNNSHRTGDKSKANVDKSDNNGDTESLQNQRIKQIEQFLASKIMNEQVELNNNADDRTVVEDGIDCDGKPSEGDEDNSENSSAKKHPQHGSCANSRADTEEDDSNKSDSNSGKTVNTDCNSRRMLIPVTFVLPPS